MYFNEKNHCTYSCSVGFGSGGINAFASNVTNKIYADAVTVEAGEQVAIPVKIENNDGFMGFSIIVTYNSDVFTPVSVSKGSVLTGMFNDSIATSTDNSFKVVFTGTADIVSDGELFSVVFDVDNDASGKYDIELSYSQQDTFKEGWENAVLNCESAEVIVTVNGTTAPPSTTTVPTTEPSTEKDEPSTKPVQEETTTQPSSEPENEQGISKPLSVRMTDWVDALPAPFNIILAIFVYPLAFLIAIFE